MSHQQQALIAPCWVSLAGGVGTQAAALVEAPNAGCCKGDPRRGCPCPLTLKFLVPHRSIGWQ